MSLRKKPPSMSKPLPPEPSAPPPPPSTLKPSSTNPVDPTSELRSRSRSRVRSDPKSTSSSSVASREDSASFTPLDLLRTVVGVLLLNTALSYFITGDSFLWGHPRPWFLRLNQVARWVTGPLLLTDHELSRYNGTDPNLPILVAVNGSIYDVSASRATYGPGGGYSFFSGRDAARAFVTGCFSEPGELCWDLRGVEWMFVPLDEESGHGDPDRDGWGNPNPREKERKEEEEEQGDEKLSSRDRKLRREKELREGRKKVHEQIRHWQDFFGKKNTKGYFEVGRVEGRKPVAETFGPVRELCEGARGSRPKRKNNNNNKKKKDKEESGKRPGDIGQKGEKPEWV